MTYVFKLLTATAARGSDCLSIRAVQKSGVVQ
jgi:hypothetical protein